jgi:hypothetical protein
MCNAAANTRTPGREGVMRVHHATAQKRLHRELERAGVGDGLLQPTFLMFREIAKI